MNPKLPHPQKCPGLLVAIIALLVLPAPALRAQDFSKPAGYLLAQAEEGQVWVNTAIRHLSLPGDKMVRAQLISFTKKLDR